MPKVRSPAVRWVYHLRILITILAALERIDLLTKVLLALIPLFGVVGVRSLRCLLPGASFM